MDPHRREFLRRTLALGCLAGGLGGGGATRAQAHGQRPERLPQGRSVFSYRGSVTVNGRPVSAQTRIAPGDLILTGPGSELIAVVGQDALMLRERSRLELGAAGAASRALRLVTGALLSVFGRRAERFEISTPVATIGIRGTGVYVESGADRTYLCTCYGSTELAHVHHPLAPERITSLHHDAPRWVLASPSSGKDMMPAPMHSHNDPELVTLESLAGREVPFAEAGRIYPSPLR